MTPGEEHKHRQAWALLSLLPRAVGSRRAQPADTRQGRRKDKREKEQAQARIARIVETKGRAQSAVPPTGALNRLGRRTLEALQRRRYELSPVKAKLLKELSA